MRNTSTNGSVARAYFFGMLLIALLLAAFSLFQPLDQRNAKLSNSEQLTATEVELTPDKTSSFSDAALHYIARHIRQKIEDDALETDLSETDLIARFLNDDTPMSVRKIDAWRLARLGSNEAKAALLQALSYGSSALRAATAEALGQSKWPDAEKILSELLIEQDANVLRGVISGLASIGTLTAVQSLQTLLFSENTDEAIRSFTALRLGDVQTDAALTLLKTAMTSPLSEDTLINVVASLAKYPFEQTTDIFQRILADDHASPELKTEATEGLANADKKALPFLLDTAGHNPDADIRASAAWAAGFNANTGKLGAQLAALVQREPDEDVRRRLYESLMRQDTIPSQNLIEHVLTENDPATRIAAANMVAMSLHQNDTDSTMEQRFNNDIIPDLLSTALGEFNTNLRFRAVFALVRSGTTDAASALNIISQQGDPQVAELANRSLADFPNSHKH